MEGLQIVRMICRLALLTVLLDLTSNLHAQSIQLGSASVTNLTVQFQVQSSSNTYIRVESSPDLVNWLPVDLFLSGSAPHVTSDVFSSTNAAQYYRALQVDPGVQITDFAPGTAIAGGQLEIYGQFLPPLTQYQVQINGANAPILSGTSTHLFVTVPTNAATGLITVSATNGSVESSDAFVVMSNAVMRFQPPGGIGTSNFVIANNYGTGVLISNTAADYSIPVREGFPTLSFAAVPGQGSNLFFCAISFGGDQVVAMNASSTASALVFQDWNLFTADPTLAPGMMGIIQSNAAVQAFAQVLATAMTQESNPYVDPAVTNAYQAAIISVLTNESFATFAASVVPQAKDIRTGSGPRPRDINSTSFVVYDVLNPPLPSAILASAAGIKGTGRYLEVTSKGLNFNMIAKDYLFNPVDWIVAYEGVDVDASFPAGRPAFEQVWQNIEITPQAYVTNGLFYAQRSVSADPFSSRIDLVGYAAKTLVNLLVPKVNSSVAIPPGDAMYVVRGIGPAFLTPADFSFVRNQMPTEYAETLTVNLANTVFKLLGTMTDDKTTEALLKSAGEINGLVVSVIQQGPIQSVDDFKRAALTILQGVIKDFLKDKVKDAAGAAIKFVAGNAVPIASLPKQLKAISTIGVLAERAAGLVNSTSLETSFIVVGDPFSLKNVTVVPAAAAPGQTVTVTFRGSKSLRAFDPSIDSVVFEGSTVFNGQVESVSGPDSVGNQTLTVTVPGSFNPNNQGAFTMYVLTQGRKGSASFTVAVGAALTAVTPIQGFVPAPNFNGVPYTGTAVRLQGALFTTNDTFLFAGGTSGVAATNVVANTSAAGDVTVHVPPGATTGALQILHQTPGGILKIPGPVFTVLGPPVITSIDPAAGGPVGSILHVTASQAGNDPSLIFYQFTGALAQNAIVRPDGALIVAIPVGAKSGFLTIYTPAGSNQAPCNVYPAAIAPAASGAIIRVGGTSGITLAQAVAFAMGTLSPTLAQASNGISTYVQIPPDYGAPWKLGPAYTNTLSGVSGDDATIPITVFMEGTFTGNLVFSADNNYVGGTYGTVSFSGNNNTLGDTFNGTVTVSGNNNSLGGTFNGPVVISGSNNVMGRSTIQAPMVISGEENTINDQTLFQNAAGNALTITGNNNSVGNFGTTWVTANAFGVNFLTNAGDGLVINGGMYNRIAINQSLGNTGNGVTLTGGAEGNLLGISTGAYSNQYLGVPGTGHQGHGLALVGSASANTINGRGSGLGGNGLDGIYMDGSGVTLNSFNGTCTFNGRNGVTITNGASLNSLGVLGASGGSSSSVVCDYNTSSGVVCDGSGANQINVLAQKNGRYGVLLSNVKALPGSFALAVSTGASGGTGSPLNIAGNGAAGLRLQNGTTGIQMVPAASTLAGDHNGVELDGAGVTSNVLYCAVLNAIGNGVLVTGGANSNAITAGATKSSADGVLLSGASNNLIFVDTSHAVSSNSLNGIHITAGSSGNHITGGFASAATRNLLNGCLVDGGASNNAIDSIDFNHNIQDGLTFSGASVTGNTLSHSQSRSNGRDGIRLEMGAFANIIGAVPALTTNFFPNDINLTGGDVEAGIAITDPGTASNVIQNCSIYGESIGVLAKNQAGVGHIIQSYLTQNTNGVVLQDGAHNGALSGLTIASSFNAGVLVSNAFNILIGSQNLTDQNQLSYNFTGIDISGPMATNNLMENNNISTGIGASGNNAVYIHNSAMQNAILGGNLINGYPCGVRIEAASSNLVSETTIQSSSVAGIIIAQAGAGNAIEGNIIQYNQTGVLVSDEGSVGNTITGNSISYNSGKGIQLSAGGNNQIAPPTLPPYSGLTVHGSSAAPDGSVVEVYRDPGGQGQTFLGGGELLGGHFSAILEVDPTTLGPPNLNATVTDPAGNTSEFSGASQQLLVLPKLAFTSTNAGHRQIYFSANGAAPVNLTGSWNGASDNYGPALASGVSCDLLLFVSLFTGTNEIWVMNPITQTQPQLLTVSPAANYSPAWLTPCQRAVFVSERDGHPQIYAVNVDGSHLLRLTTNSAADTSPNPFLEGARIIFISDRSGSRAIWVMNADGSSQSPVTGVPGTPDQPAVSPDGLTVALADTQNNVSEIAIVRLDGSGFVQLTNDKAHATHPTWLPDGQHLIFSSDRSGMTNLYSINISGAGLQALPLSPDAGAEPSAGGD
jgi:hypothetical protein